MRKLLIALAIVLTPVLSSAQAVTSLVWDFPNTTPAYIATATFHQLVGDGIPVAAQITCAASTITPTTTTCSSVLPASLTSAGNHVYAVTLTAEGVSRSTTATIDPSKGKQPGGIRINISVVVQVP